MKSNKRWVRLAGILIALQLVAATISYSIILEPVLYGSKDFLPDVAGNLSKVRIAILLDFIVGALWFGAAVLLFPILKKYSERIGLWFVGMRLAEFVTLIISGILLFTLIYTSREYTMAMEKGNDGLYGLGNVIRYGRGMTQNLSLLAYSFGSVPFYLLLYKTRLLPRFISVWGLIGVAGLLADIIPSMFGHSLGAYMYLIMLPMGTNEILLAIWLMVKGVNMPEENGVTE